ALRSLRARRAGGDPDLGPPSGGGQSEPSEPHKQERRDPHRAMPPRESPTLNTPVCSSSGPTERQRLSDRAGQRLRESPTAIRSSPAVGGSVQLAAGGQ